jgi:hypothetical protein
MSRNLRLLGVPLIVVALAACGSSSKSTAPTPTTEAPNTTTATEAPVTTTTAPAVLDSCALVTKAQAEAVIGTKLQTGTQVSNSDPNGPTAQVEVFVGAGAKKFYDDDNNVLKHTFTDVPGVGDESHEEDFSIFFRKGSTWVALRLTSLDDFSTFKTRLEDLAKNVAGRI